MASAMAHHRDRSAAGSARFDGLAPSGSRQAFAVRPRHVSGHAPTGRDSSRSAKLTKTGPETDCLSELRIGFRIRMHSPTGSTRRAIVREERNDALARGTDCAVGFAAATDRCQVAKIALACASFASSVHVIRASGVDCSNILRDNFFQANVMTTTPSSNTSRPHGTRPMPTMTRTAA